VIFDGYTEHALERLTGSPRVEVHESLPSVLDRAHQLGAEGATDGTLIVADRQTAGRGRQGRSWLSPPGAGLWLAALLRPQRAPAGGSLAIRAGLAARDAVAALAPELQPRLKWPNDLVVAGRKAGGVLCEGRWTGEQLAWVAVGVGVNVRGPLPDEVTGRAVALCDFAPALTRPAVLVALAPRLRALSTQPPELEETERRHFQSVQWTGEGAEPGGIGVDADGALLVRLPDGKLDRRVVPA
jgi:BirA family biotin operon repressor/biotin-[acetyl-CoA-carboxylase] ligase